MVDRKLVYSKIKAMKTTVLSIAGLLVLSVAFLAFTTGDSSYKNSPDITYRVACDDCAVSYRDVNGASTTETVKEVWEYSFTAQTGQFIYLSATSEDGTAVIEIEQGGKVVKHQQGNSARGGFLMP